MVSSSVPAIRAKSSNASIPTAVDMQVWWAAPACSHDVADVWKSGDGRHTARPTGSRGSGSAGGTTSTTFATSRKRSRTSDSATTTPGPGSALKTSRTGSSLPPMPSGWISSVGRVVVRLGQTSSMCAPRMSSLPGVRS